MKNGPKIKIVEESRHRNGVCGEPFDAVLFDDDEEGRMLAILFEDPSQCAVLNVARLTMPEYGVRMGRNAWRGDHYSQTLRAEIRRIRGTCSACEGSGEENGFEGERPKCPDCMGTGERTTPAKTMAKKIKPLAQAVAAIVQAATTEPFEANEIIRSQYYLLAPECSQREFYDMVRTVMAKPVPAKVRSEKRP